MVVSLARQEHEGPWSGICEKNQKLFGYDSSSSGIEMPAIMGEFRIQRIIKPPMTLENGPHP
jgi:hypothetical protein